MTITCLLIASEWEPSKGGVSTFNMELALALARTGHEVHCVVPRAPRDQIVHAASRGVSLHSAAAEGVVDGAPFDLGFIPNIIIGHDRWTSPGAVRWKDKFPSAFLVLFLHVHPDQIDGLKSSGSIMARPYRVEEGRLRIKQADVAFGVGDLLTNWWSSTVPDVKIHSFVPGLPTTLPEVPTVIPEHPRVLLIGRAEDAELKGVPVAARAMKMVVDSQFPDAELVIRGITPGTDTQFEALVRDQYPIPRRFTSRPFDPSREAIARDLATCTVALQPSLEEGFGLVALESIAMGTPVLVSNRSGIASLLRKTDESAAKRFVVMAGDEKAWQEAISAVLRAPIAACQSTTELRKKIAASVSWDASALTLVSVALASTRRSSDNNRRSRNDQFRDANANVAELPARIDGNWIPRSEENSLNKWLNEPLPEHENGLLLLVGAPGAGKSALLATLLRQANTSDTPVLGIKADLVPANVDSIEDLQAHLDLEEPIEAMLRAASTDRGRAILLVDQLDAVCEVVDTKSRRLNVLIQLIRNSLEIESVRVVASIRPFELRHEARLRRLHANARVLTLESLSVADVRRALRDVAVPDGVAPDLLTPHALDLMVQVKKLRGARFVFPPSIGQLRQQFWNLAVGGKDGLEDVALEIAREMRNMDLLWIEKHHLRNSDSVEKLVECGVLRESPDRKHIGFRHQTLFDFCQAKELLRSGSLAGFAHDRQHSFEIRPLIRSALLHLRSDSPGDYAKAVEDLFALPALHLRLLVVDTILESSTPSRQEIGLLVKAVQDAGTRRRAFNLLAQRTGWLLSLGHLISAWMSDFPEDSLQLARGYLRVDPRAALKALELNWMGTDDGRNRILGVVSRADRLGPEADTLLHALVPHIVSSPFQLYEFRRLSDVLIKSDARRAMAFLVSCLREEGRHFTREEGQQFTKQRNSSVGRVADEFLEMDLDPTLILDELEKYFEELMAGKRPYEVPYQVREPLVELIEKLLRSLLVAAPQSLLGRASNIIGEHHLLPSYLRVLGEMTGLVSERISWLIADPERMVVDPETPRFLQSISESLDAYDVSRLEVAIDSANLYSVSMSERDARWRMRRHRLNRAYRLYLREQLPRRKRSSLSLRADDAERRQLYDCLFRPQRGPRAGWVRSPMTAEQLARASNSAILGALRKPRERHIYDENGQAVGGAGQITSELTKLGKDNPQRIVALIEILRESGMKKHARRLLDSVLEHHPDPSRLEDLVVSLLAKEDAPLERDDKCAWALKRIANHAPLGPTTLARVFRRLENAREASSSQRDVEADDSVDSKGLALFSGSYLGGMVPSGAFSWLEALYVHYVFSGQSDPPAWIRAVRCALHADRRSLTWQFVLDAMVPNWRWLSGEEAFGLVDEIAKAVGGRSTSLAITRVFSGYRNIAGVDLLKRWIEHLVQCELYAAAAELVCILCTDSSPVVWADATLSEWRKSEFAGAFSVGVMAACGNMFADSLRRRKVSLIVEEWLSVAHSEGIELFSDEVLREEVWQPDEPSRNVLRALLSRMSSLNLAALRVVFVLEGFLEVQPGLVLELTEAILSRALDIGGDATHAVISECLALSVSLRIALPSEQQRVHSVFERALAAGASAASEALDALDGRSIGGVEISWYRPLRVRKRMRSFRS